MTTHHELAGTSNSAANRIEVRGQRTDIGFGRNVRANPGLAPR
jgi:hypothetical protein